MSNYKIKYLFENSLDQSCFKENRFIFDTTEKPDAKTKAEAEARAKEEEAAKIEKEAKEKVEALRQEAQDLRKEAGKEVADQNTVLDPIDKELDGLNQEKFDNFMKNLPMLKTDLSVGQIYKLFKFALDSGEKQKDNFDKLISDPKGLLEILINNADLHSLKTVLEKLDKEIFKELYKKINKKIQEREEEERKAREAARAETIFSAETPTDEVLEKSIGLVRQGKSVGWTFEIEVDGEKIQSDRSFSKSKKFLRAFEEFRNSHKDGVTENQVKAFCYKWLWEKVYKGGKKTEAIGQVTKFGESQEMLKSEIKRLGGETPSSKAEYKGKDKGEEKADAETKTKNGTTSGEPDEKGKRPPEKEERTERNEAADDKKPENTKAPDSETKIVKLPETITNDEKSNLEKSIQEITKKFNEALRTGSNAFEVIASLRAIGRELGGILKAPLEVQFIDQATKETFNWSSEIAETNGFGNRNELINKILALKRIEFKGETDSPEYMTFFMQSRIAKAQEEREGSQAAKLKEYRAKYKEFTSQVYIIDYRIGDLSEEDMASKFGLFDGHASIERIMGKSPFNVPQRQVGSVIAEIISEDDNDRIYFEDIFEYSKSLPGFKTIAGEGKIDKELLKDADDLLEKYEEVLAKKDNPELEAYMFEKVIGPCIELLNAIHILRFEKTKTVDFKDPIDIAKKSIPEDQLAIIASLQTLFNYSEDKSNAYEDFLGWISGAKKITMANMDGTTFDVDQGMFQRHYDPKAALFIMLEKPGLYTIENGQKKINEEALLNAVNDLMLKGYITKELGKLTPKNGKSLEPKEVKELQDRIIGESAKYQIQSLKGQKFTKDQIMAFQVGFLNTEIAESEQEINKGMDRYLDEVFKGEKPLEPGERKILLAIIKQQGEVKPKYLKEIRPKLEEAGKRLKEYVANKGKISTNLFHGHFQFDQDGNLVGGGIAIPFTLSDGATLTIGLGAAKGAPGGVFAGLDFSVKIAGGEGWNVSHFSSISIIGAATGFHGTHEIEEGVDLWWMAGLSASWPDVINFGVGAGIGISYDKWRLKKQEENTQGEIAKETGWDKETLKKWPGLSVDEKYSLLQKSPHWSQIQIVANIYPDYLDKENLVHAYDIEMKRLAGETDRRVEFSAPSLIPVGIGVGAIAPALITAISLGNPVLGIALGLIAGAKFRLGTVEIFIPHPKEEQNILELASDANARAQVEKLLADMKDGTSSVEFTERTPDVYWKPGSGLGKGIRIENKEINLTNIRTDFETYNEALKKGDVDLQLQKHADGKIEINIGNLFNRDKVADKDLEIHIDPSLYALGIIADGGRLFIEGNLDDLIITRERFRFSHLQAEGRSSIRDIITIRQKSSLNGKQKIDRQWLQEFEPHYLEILMGQKEFRKEEGLNPRAGYGNIQMLKDFATMPPGWEKSEGLKTFYAHRPETMKIGNEGKVIDKAKIEKYKTDIQTRHKELGAISKEAFEAEKTRAEFNKKMRKLFIDPDFHEKFGEIADKPAKVVDFVKTYTDSHKEFGLDNLTHKEITIAENMLRDFWFTTAYRAEGPLSKLELDKDLLNRLKRAGFKNISNLDILTAVDIKDTFARKKIAITDDEAAKIVEIVQKFKERPLSNEELIEKNTQLKKRIELVRDYCTQKFIDAFSEVIGKMEPPLSNTNAETLVKEHFMKGVYDGILEKLSDKTNPIDFRKIDIENIPTGADLISGTRIIKGSERIKALSHTLFEQPDKSEVQIHNFGFLTGTTKEYKLSDTGVNQDIARILLEIASPVPEDDIELLKSTFAIKILGLGAHRLVTNDEEYQLITELCQDPSKAREDKYKTALTNFRTLIKEIRDSQHKGGIYTYKSDKGYTVKIDMVKETAIKSGAYAQCTNPSFYVNEKGLATVKGQARGTIAARADITQVTDAVTDIASVTFSISGGVTLQRKPKIIPTPTIEDTKPEPIPGGGVATEIPKPAVPAGTPAAPKGSTGDSPPGGNNGGVE